MSLLMFMHQEKSALILTDTGAPTPDGEPLMFTRRRTVRDCQLRRRGEACSLGDSNTRLRCRTVTETAARSARRSTPAMVRAELVRHSARRDWTFTDCTRTGTVERGCPVVTRLSAGWTCAVERAARPAMCTAPAAARLGRARAGLMFRARLWYMPRQLAPAARSPQGRASPCRPPLARPSPGSRPRKVTVGDRVRRDLPS